MVIPLKDVNLGGAYLPYISSDPISRIFGGSIDEIKIYRHKIV